MNKNKRWRDQYERPSGYPAKVCAPHAYEGRGLNSPPCDYVRGREVECTAPPLERPCRAPRPGARLKARPVWRSPRLGSSWIKDGSLEGQERWEAPATPRRRQTDASRDRKERKKMTDGKKRVKTTQISIYQLFNKNYYSVRWGRPLRSPHIHKVYVWKTLNNVFVTYLPSCCYVWLFCWSTLML